jgi:hypothetical protein
LWALQRTQGLSNGEDYLKVFFKKFTTAYKSIHSPYLQSDAHDAINKFETYRLLFESIATNILLPSTTNNNNNNSEAPPLLEPTE